jgi:hypothetical protein
VSQLTTEEQIEERHGSPGALRATVGGVGGPFRGPHY